MFSKLKEKIKDWTRKISEKTEEKEKTILKSKGKTKNETKDIPLPQKFNIALQKYEPDLEEIKKIPEGIKSEEEKPIEQEKKSLFKRIKGKVYSTEISLEEFEKYSEELELLLIENNVALEVAEKIIKELEKNIVGREISKKDLEKEIKESLRKILEKILLEPFDLIDLIKKEKEKPYVILFCGINGSGKTTTIAKLAHKLKIKGISCVIAAGDTFRAASIEQIKKHGEKLGIKVISNEYGADPASVGFDSINYAKKNSIDCVLIDTAGRMHTSKNLLREIEKVSRVCNPHLKIFVGESITGNDSIEQIKGFDSSIGVDGIILSKADVDEKGGTALSVGYTTNKPIIYIGTGQKYEDLEKFDRKKILEKIGL